MISSPPRSPYGRPASVTSRSPSSPSCTRKACARALRPSSCSLLVWMTTSAVLALPPVCVRRVQRAVLGLPLGLLEDDAAAGGVAGQGLVVFAGAPPGLIAPVSGILGADDP